MEIYRYPLNCFYTVSTVENHTQIKDAVLPLIDNTVAPSLNQNSEYYTDSISKVDWQEGRNMEREWVKQFLPMFTPHLETVISSCGYETPVISEIWFQQYLLGSTHGWHTHSSNMTAVYYLEFPDGSPRTEVVAPFCQSKIFEPDVKEGTLLVFPAITVHRAPVVQHDIRKTIISFNFNTGNPTKKCLDGLKFSNVL